MEHTEERNSHMGLLLGIGIVAAFLLLMSGHLGHVGAGWRGPIMTSWHGAPAAPWLAFGLAGALLLALVGLFPLALVIGGGYLLYRVLSGGSVHMPAFSLGRTGAGGAPSPVEPGIFCPSCERPVSRNWATCPHCGYRKYVAPDLIQRRCATCGTELQKDWNACPYCSTRIDTPLLVPAPGPAAPKTEEAPREATSGPVL